MLDGVTWLFLALVLAAPCTSEPTTTVHHRGRSIRVPEDYPSIAEALGASGPNDRILIGSGTYHERLELPDHDIMLISTDGPEVTMLDGGSNSLRPPLHFRHPTHGVLRMGTPASRH